MKTAQLTSEASTRLDLLKQRLAAHEAACDHISPRKRNGWRVMTADESAQVNVLAPMTNDERTELERLDFIANPPARYFAYVKTHPHGEHNGSPALTYITGWTGQMLATVRWQGRPYRSAFGDWRVNFRAFGVNDRLYSGTFYKSSGDYCRMRQIKA